MPHLGAIQQSFGSHDASSIQAHTGSAATQANEAMGAEAYATGNHVAFKGTPDLHTAAHEAAHVVQQRSGVSLDGGVGAVGDSYEQHADKVADAVVSGQSAEGILNEMSGGSSDVQQKAVQKAPPGGSTPGGAHGAPGSPHARTGATGDTVGGETVPAPRPKTASEYKSLPGWTDFDALVSPLSSPGEAYQHWKICIDQIDVNEQMWTKVGGDWTKTKTFIDTAGRGVFEQVASQLLPTAFDPTKTYGLFSGNLAKEYARSQVTILNDTAAGKIAEHLHASAPGKKWAFMQALWRAVSNVYAERVAFLNQGVNVYGRYEGDVFAEVEAVTLTDVANDFGLTLDMRCYPLVYPGRFAGSFSAPSDRKESFWTNKLEEAAGKNGPGAGAPANAMAKVKAAAPQLYMQQTQEKMASLTVSGPMTRANSTAVIENHEKTLIAHLKTLETRFKNETAAAASSSRGGP